MTSDLMRSSIRRSTVTFLLRSHRFKPQTHRAAAPLLFLMRPKTNSGSAVLPLQASPLWTSMLRQTESGAENQEMQQSAVPPSLQDRGAVPTARPLLVQTGFPWSGSLRRKEEQAPVVKRRVTPEEIQASEGRRSRLELKTSPEPKAGQGLTAGRRRWEETKRREGNQKPSLREVQWMLLRRTSSPGGGGVAALLMKHITKEKKKLRRLTSSSMKTPSSGKGVQQRPRR
ncbi:hypothetical protein OJAV_G00135140 [Oryzias javanicus]|uniref:Uncharacterized protein n=1 Tax=Oryzias javanicus TaxID=123683 RepID=A0A437CSE0_ORYJA|nr:hypothetical protein OJAV_G00135140 [Oryzias javanicus]